jgi:molybdate transport system ATP-binding protein
MRAKPFLTLENASFRLGDRLVFENTSWQFNNHEHWAVLGPNGSGKSLLGDALRGHLPLVKGDLDYHFRPPPGLSPEESISHVAFEDRRSELHDAVVQSRWNSLEDTTSCSVRSFLSYEHVLELNPFEVEPAASRAEAQRRRSQFNRLQRRLIEDLSLRPLLDRAVLSLSNGETQRLQLARALCRPTRLLLLDEPFAGLDAGSRSHFRQVLQRLMRASLRVVLLTTRAEDLPSGITHVLWLEDCRVIAAGPRNKLLAQFGFSRSSSSSPIKNQKSEIKNDSRPSLQRSPRSFRPLIVLRNIHVSYGRSTILNNLNWTVRAHESWALLGPNGSGKTTLLSLILGDHPQAYANDITVFGRRRGSGESIWDVKHRIGWVSPELHLHFTRNATCFEVIASGFHDTIGLFQSLTRRQCARTRLQLADFGLLPYADTPLYGLSAGTQRMALLARALVKNPRLLILDEPCQGLDSAHRTAFVQTVDRLIRSGTVTVLYVTHRTDELPPSIHNVLRLP